MSALAELPLTMLDAHAWSLPADLWAECLRHTHAEVREYERHRHDCDDFAVVLKGQLAHRLAMGSGCALVIDLSGGHAYSALLTHDYGELYWRALEPQTDRYVRPGAGMYRAQRGYALL